MMCEDYASQLGCASASALRWKYNPQITPVPSAGFTPVPSAGATGQAGQGGQKSEVGDQRSEIRGRPSEMRCAFVKCASLLTA